MSFDLRSAPRTVPLPEVGRWSVARTRKRVVLPDPLGPSNPIFSPASRHNLTRWRITVGPTRKPASSSNARGVFALTEGVYGWRGTSATPLIGRRGPFNRQAARVPGDDAPYQVEDPLEACLADEGVGDFGRPGSRAALDYEIDIAGQVLPPLLDFRNRFERCSGDVDVLPLNGLSDVDHHRPLFHHGDGICRPNFGNGWKLWLGHGGRLGDWRVSHFTAGSGRGRVLSCAVASDDLLTLEEVLERYSGGPQTGVFTDGSSVPNPGPGGWGAVYVVDGEVIDQAHGSDSDTTNNRMELIALIQACDLVPLRTSVTIYSDSNLAVQSMNDWVHGWKERGWKRKTGPIQNLDLVKDLHFVLQSRSELTLEWIRAHDGSVWNEYADSLANAWRREEL